MINSKKAKYVIRKATNNFKKGVTEATKGISKELKKSMGVGVSGAVKQFKNNQTKKTAEGIKQGLIGAYKKKKK